MRHFKNPLYSILAEGGNNSFAAAAEACGGSAEASAQSDILCIFSFYLVRADVAEAPLRLCAVKVLEFCCLRRDCGGFAEAPRRLNKFNLSFFH